MTPEEIVVGGEALRELFDYGVIGVMLVISLLVNFYLARQLQKARKDFTDHLRRRER